MNQTPQSAFALALFVSYLVASAAGALGLDGVLYAIFDNTGTISHGMYVAGTNHPWVRAVWLFGGLLFVLGLYVHFWGLTRPW